MTPQLAYLIKSTPKTYLGLKRQNKTYVIGFKHMSIAAKVLQHVDGEAKMELLSTDEVSFHEPITQTTLQIDSQATLFIPKLQTFGQTTNQPNHAITDPINNNDLYLHSLPFEDFLMYPTQKQVGVIIPYVLVLEDKHEFVYTAHVINPN